MKRMVCEVERRCLGVGNTENDNTLSSQILSMAHALGYKVKNDMICTPDGKNCVKVEEWIRSPMAAFTFIHKNIELERKRIEKLEKKITDVSFIQYNPDSCWAATGIILSKYLKKITQSSAYDDFKVKNLQTALYDLKSNNLNSFLHNYPPAGKDKDRELEAKIQNYLVTTNENEKKAKAIEIFKACSYDQLSILCQYSFGTKWLEYYLAALFYSERSLNTPASKMWFKDTLNLRYEKLNPGRSGSQNRDADNRRVESRLRQILKQGPFITTILPEAFCNLGINLRDKINDRYHTKNQDWKENLPYHYIIVYDITYDNGKKIVKYLNTFYYDNDNTYGPDEYACWKTMINKRQSLRRDRVKAEQETLDFDEFLYVLSELNELLILVGNVTGSDSYAQIPIIY